MDVDVIARCELKRLTALNDEQVEQLLAAKVLPPPIKTSKSGRKPVWLKSEVQGWQERRTIERWAFVETTVGDHGVSGSVRVFKGPNSRANALRYAESVGR